MAHTQQQIHTTNTHTMGCFGSTLASKAKIPNVPNEFILQTPMEQEKPQNELIDILARQRPGSYLKYTVLQKHKRTRNCIA